MKRPSFLKPRLQNYDWGDPDFIADLLDREHTGAPVAEAWFGAHPSLPSWVAVAEQEVGLDQVVHADPKGQLGARVEAAFGAVPFLLKVLSAARPLSIQVHPSKGQARRGFRAPPNTPTSGYADENHKPELLVALTDFYALCGFRSTEAIARTLEHMPEFAALLPRLSPSAASLRRLVEAYYGLNHAVRQEALLAWLERLETLSFDETHVEHWALCAHHVFSSPDAVDPGLFFFALLNFVALRPGEGLFLPAGALHAYLRGSGLEVMANSDNVVRGGLTNKPVNVPELLQVTRFEASPPWLVAPAPRRTKGGVHESLCRTPALEFQLSVLELPEEGTLEAQSDGPEVLLVLAGGRGSTTLQTDSNKLRLSRGEACWVPDGIPYTLSANSGARVARITVPAPEAARFRNRRPTELAFGTSGLRGLVTDITDLEAYVNVRGFVAGLVERGEVLPGASLALAGDLRPSTHSDARSILTAALAAVRDAGLEVEYLGRLPTPALASYALERHVPGVMVTGSHIPFDRNGIKFYKPGGEVLKADEPFILEHIAELRRRLYLEPEEASRFDDLGALRARPALPTASSVGSAAYVQRYVDFFGQRALAGLRLGVYQHSAVGRDLLVELFGALGAEVFPFGRSEAFVAIDTEAVTEADLASVQLLVSELTDRVGPLHAVISTDGDGDRPLLFSLDDQGHVRFHHGDRLGMVTAELLRATTIVVPVSATDGIEAHFVPLGRTVVRTRIGSPHAIAALDALAGEGKVAWESNGGFLLGSDISLGGRTLRALPTRDAVLPLIAVLRTALTLPGELSVERAFAALPARYTAAALLDHVRPSAARAVRERFTPKNSRLVTVEFTHADVKTLDAAEKPGSPTASDLTEVTRIRSELRAEVAQAVGDLDITQLNFLDGIRMTLTNGEILHVRPSGNAPQLRIYVVADSEQRASGLAREATAPGGLLQRLLGHAERAQRVEGITRNIAHGRSAIVRSAPPALVGTVSASREAQRFWQRRLERVRARLGARTALSLHEDLPVNQAFGLLLAWQRLRPALPPGEGALIAFVFGEGMRATPFTETDNGQKPAMLSFVASEPSDEAPFLPMVELALGEFALVESHLRRSGFDGLVVKWGDEVQIPSTDLSGTNPLLANADVVRFVSMQTLTEHSAANKDWLGVDAEGNLTSFIPRRPLSEMAPLVERGLLRREGTALVAGVNLGSIAVSRGLLDALLREFAAEVNDATANRKQRPDLDPQFFTALVIARIEEAESRQAAWQLAQAESPLLAELDGRMPRLLERLRGVLVGFEQEHGRKVRMVALDFGDPYWGDIGQHRQIHDFFHALREDGPNGVVARALAGVPEQPDAAGNRIVASSIAPSAHVRDSVLIGCRLGPDSAVNGSVLIGTRALALTSEGAFDVDSAVTHLTLGPRAGSYRIVSEAPVALAPGERATSLFLGEADGGSPFILRVLEDTDLRDRAANYAVPIQGNPLSFEQAHQLATRADPERVLHERRTAVERVLGRWSEPS